MKPVELIFQAIGPYPKKVSIPFYKLQNNGLYLISGVTGSGKTTIFDCICFALFNSTSGSFKDNNFLRSHFAKDDVESFVELTFEHKNQIYKIQRTPPFERKKLKGEGTIKEKGKAQLTLPNSKLIIGTKEVDEYIIELLGLDLAQFSQIALLAQGEFLKLLNTDSQKRGEIFRNIFKTQDYSTLQLKIKDELINYKNDWQDYKKAILQYICQIETDDDFLKEQIQTCINNDSFALMDVFLQKLNSQNDLDKKQNKELSEQINKNQTEINSLNLIIEKINQKISLNIEMETVSNELMQEAEISKEIQKQYLEIENKEQQKEDLKNRLSKTELDYKNAITVLDLEKVLEQRKTAKQEFEGALVRIEDNIINLKYSYFAILNEQLQKLQDKLDKKQVLFEALKDEYNNANNRYIENYNLFLSMQAGILAKELKQNSPCPVCGSIEHPNIAKVVDKNIDKNFVDNLKEMSDKAQNDLNQVSADCADLKNLITSKEKDIEEFKKRFQIEDNFDFEKVNVFDFELDLVSLDNLQKEKLEAILKIENEIVEIVSKIELLSKNLNEADIDLIIKEQTQLNKEIEELSNQINNIKENFEKQSILISALKSKKELLLKQIQNINDISIKDKDDIIAKINELSGKNDIINDDLKKVFSRFDLNTKLFEQISKKYDEFVEIEKKYSTYKTLNDLACGNLRGKPRIAFEQYIQGYYLDLVLNEANKRFKIMTNGQFQLLRKKDTDSLVSKTGLDIEVMDFHTFKKRSVKSLSGGESFKAALSLALGLSDCVSNLSGVIDIDSLFIDEGFGSLDEDSLDLAMEVIVELGLTNRLVGIISHVKELRNKIQNQIISTKSQAGSTIEIIF